MEIHKQHASNTGVLGTSLPPLPATAMLHSAAFALALHRYVCERQQLHAERVPYAAAQTIWRATCGLGLNPTSSLSGLGFSVEHNQVEPLPEPLALQYATLLDKQPTGHQLLSRIQDAIGDRSAARLAQCVC